MPLSRQKLQVALESSWGNGGKGMSAFGAIFGFSGDALAPGDLERMALALATGGPDGKGHHRDKTWGMVFRLRRFTPEDLYEQQPLRHESGRYWLLADARIDNRDELLAEFSIAPSAAAKLPDSRLILLAYLRWGEDCPRKLIGDFAFVIWDDLERRLFAACDPMARRTLLYHRTASRLVIATSYKGLHALPHVPRDIDYARLADFLVMRPMEPGSTVYQGIGRLPPAHSLSTDGRHWSIRRYWSVDPGHEIRLPDDGAYREAFLDLYGRVIQSHLRARGPLGIFMSGGLDSSSIGAMAARKLGERGQSLTAFTLVHRRSFDPGVQPERINPEYAYVEAIRRRHPNIDVVYVTGKQDRLLDGFEEAFDMIGAPPHSISHDRRIRALYREVRTRNIQVVLNGYQGNRTISYNGTDFLPHAFLTGQWRRVYDGIQALRPLMRASAARLFLRLVVRPLMPAGLLVRPPAWAQLRGLNENFRHRIGNPVLPTASSAPDWQRVLNPRLRHKIDFIGGLAHNAMDEWIGSRAELGIEERDPTGDRRIVEFCLALPMHQFLRRGANRFLIRHAMEGLLPDEVRWREYFLPREADYGEHVQEAMADLRDELAGLERRSDQPELLDTWQIRALLDVPDRQQAESVYLPFRRAMRAVQVGRFIRWAEGAND